MYTPNTPSFPPPGQPPFGPPPSGPTGPPPVLTWFKVYTGLMAALYLLCFGAGIALVIASTSTSAFSSNERTQFLIMGVAYGVLGFIFLLLYAYGLMMPRKPWAWVYGVVLIGIGMTSICCLPATIPLLIHWLKPETKAFYGRE